MTAWVSMFIKIHSTFKKTELISVAELPKNIKAIGFYFKVWRKGKIRIHIFPERIT